MKKYTPQQIADLISEEEVEIDDNDIGSIIHHLEDVLKGYRSNEPDVVKGSLKDIYEIAQELVRKLSPREQAELR